MYPAIRRTCLHPAYPAAITLLGLIVGLVGSIYTNEIRSAFPFVWPPLGPISWPACVFWLSVIVTTALFFTRQVAVDSATERAQQDLIDATKDLEQLVRTQPPKNFLALAAELYDGCEDVVASSLQSVPIDKDTVRQGVRHILRIIATLAQHFDGNDPKVRYAANIMWYRPATTIDPALEKQLRDRLLFTDESVAVHQLRGVLDLDAVLSTLSSDAAAAPDPKLKPFALPVPRTATTNDGKHRVLPGAPLALVDMEPDFFSDCSKLRDWCKEYGDFTQDVQDQLDRHFRDDAEVKSFASIPLLLRNSAAKEPFAVLNIHCDVKGLLKAEVEPAEQFVLVIRPFQASLIKLLAAIR